METQFRLALIGGTGFSEMAREPRDVKTDYGDVKVSPWNWVARKSIFCLARRAGNPRPRELPGQPSGSGPMRRGHGLGGDSSWPIGS